MKFKKMFSFFMISIFVLGLCSCNKNNGPESKSLYEEGMEVVELLAEHAGNEECVDIYTGNDEIKEIIADIGSHDYSKVDKVYEVVISDETLSAMAELDRVEGASEELKKLLKAKSLSAVTTQINGMAGVEKLAASSVCTVSRAFANDNIASNTIYIYTFEEGFPVAVTFIAGEDKVVSANGIFILFDKFTYGSAEEIKNFFSELSPEVNEVSKE